ncbi:protein Dok-7 isoform X2 [Esox lucius]|uniref:protein Dok-7 isoform X2 n=1 Tax=Esox lucius TaxID=8010 RepID=UPI001476DD9C|nr:protein Dok-7 isoform X2 [Esox lucius]
MKMTDSVVVEGYVKFRDGKKWKNRWVVLRKPSPVADCLVLLVYKDKSDKGQGHRERASVTLEDICGLESGVSYEGVGHTLSILCLSQAAVLGFDGKDTLLAWEIRIRYSLGEVHRFSVGILPGTKLECGPATLHLCNNLLVLARDLPPVIIGQWNLPDLRRYGPVPNGFVFEGGTRCGYWAGVFFLSSLEGEQISFLFDCIVRGISPTRGPFGLRPVLPVPDAVASQAHAEERMNQEAQELEKRISMLAHLSSTASSYVPSVAGDDHSISGSSENSDTSQSDSSIGSRLAIWTEAVTTSSAPAEIITGQSGPKVTSQAEEKLSVGQVGGARTVAKPPRSRQLQEIGRQSSSDSGIATGSHSSYSGSFSSYTGSLDFGSLLSLPPHLASDLAPCTCPPAPGPEYQTPTSLRYLYDSPRTVLQGDTAKARGQESSTKPKDKTASSRQSSPSCDPTQGEEGAHSGGCSDTVRCSTAELVHGRPERKSSAAPPSDSQHPDSCLVCSTAQTTASRTLLTICQTCGGVKGNPLPYPGGSAMPAIPGERIDRGSFRPNSSSFEYVQVASPKTTMTAGPLASVTDRSTENLRGIREGPAGLQTRDRGRLANLLADLVGYRGSSGEPGTKTDRLNLYESMATASGRELRSQHPVTATGPLGYPTLRKGERTVIYENCLKCGKGDGCHPPARGTPTLSSDSVVERPSHIHHSGVRLGLPPPSEPSSQNRVDRKETPDWRPIEVQLLDSEVQDGDLPCVDVKGHSVSVEDKKQRRKEERSAVEYEIMESRALEKSSEPEEKCKYELMGSYGTPWFLHETDGKCSTKYAQIDITATDAAHKTGTQHALGREEGLHTLEQRRKGVSQ